MRGSHGCTVTSRGRSVTTRAEWRRVANAPQGLTLKRHRDQAGRAVNVWARRAFLALLALLLVLALVNVFGQRPRTSVAAAPAGRLTVYAPTHARSGVVYAARFRIDAAQELRDATLVLWPGWADGYTVNGQAPQPVTQGSDDGKLVYGFGHVPAGQHLTFWLSLQVNPTNVGRHTQRVDLYDGKSRLATVNRDITIFP
jgi:hypothetical protein